MAAKRFHIARPDQLQSLVKYTKDDPCTVAKVARIWEAARQRKGTARWDNGIFAGFSGDRSRDAALFRASGDELVRFGTLKYNTALNWCEQNLR